MEGSSRFRECDSFDPQEAEVELRSPVPPEKLTSAEVLAQRGHRLLSGLAYDRELRRLALPQVSY
jgi:hypothetical protein